MSTALIWAQQVWASFGTLIYEISTLDRWIAVIACIAAVAVAWPTIGSWLVARKSVGRHLELKLWLHGDRILEVYATLHNKGFAAATIDQLTIVRPKGSKVAFHQTPNVMSRASALTDPDVSNIHHVRLDVDAGKSAGVGMVIELPRDAGTVKSVCIRARMSATDLAKRYVVLDSTVRMSSAIVVKNRA